MEELKNANEINFGRKELRKEYREDMSYCCKLWVK